MKKIIVSLLAMLILCSCASNKYMQTTYWADYSKYSKEGFTISPSSSGFTYESIGELEIVFKCGVKDGYTDPNIKTYTSHMFYPNIDYIVKEAVKEAKSKGANAILNFKIEPQYQYSASFYFDRRYIGAVVTGFAVKLK